MNKIAFFGTSHTYGSCSDIQDDQSPECISHAWPEQVAEIFNANHLNFGLPGSPNIEIQILLVEAFTNGLLDDVDTIIIEPRLSHDHILWNNHNKSHEGTQPLYARTKAGHKEFGIKEAKNKSIHHRYVQELNINNLDNTKEYERKMKKPIHKLMLNKLRHCVETLHYYNQDTVGMLYQSYQYVKTWKIMCESIDKKFYWINWTSTVNDSMLNEYFKDINDCCLNLDLSVADFMAAKTSDEKQNYFCGCKHFNVKAQPHIAKFIAKRLKKLTTR